MGMQLLNEIDQMRAAGRRAKDMSIQDITRIMDPYTIFTATVFADSDAPAFLAWLKSIAESWLIYALSGRPNTKLATYVIQAIVTIESLQARWVGVAEVKYLDTRGYPLVAQEGGLSYGLDDLEVTGGGTGGSTAPTGTAGTKSK
jgi:hypothetical protein